MSERPALVSIDQRADGRAARVVITLEWHNGRYRGEASGPAGDTARARLLGEATLRALETIAPGGLSMTLDAIATTPFGESRVAMAQVTVHGEPSLVGSALEREDDVDAAPVRAVLDAVNRKLSRVL